jgi:outer membrane protein OmpA-like peptidoglycan-associated protein
LRLAALALLALVLAGCCAPRKQVGAELFAVIPAATDGHAGSIFVERGGERRVIDTPYGAQRLRADGGFETAQLDPAEVRRIFGAALDALPGVPTSYTLYFLEGKDELTPESAIELDKVFGDLKRRPLPDIVVIGHTDTVGGLEYNDRLSRARAERMREMMVQLGIPGNRIQAAGRGKRELLVPTDDNVSEPRNRRVEINVR